MRIVYELEPGAKAPQKAHESDAGFDLYAYDFDTKTGLISTGVRMLIPDGHVGLIWPRSSLSAKGYVTATGVIDAGYTGIISVAMWDYDFCLHNGEGYALRVSPHEMGIKKGDRVAQIVILQLPGVSLVPGAVASVKTKRGCGGFGSTGK